MAEPGKLNGLMSCSVLDENAPEVNGDTVKSSSGYLGPDALG